MEQCQQDGRVVFLKMFLIKRLSKQRILFGENVNTDNLDVTAKQVGIGAVVFTLSIIE